MRGVSHQAAKAAVALGLASPLALTLAVGGLPAASAAATKSGPALLLRSGTVDLKARTVTLPLQRGRMKDGRRVWFVITDASDAKIARERKINHSPKLANAPTGRGARVATRESDGTLVFENGTVDFTPARMVTPGARPNPFPPKAAEPGSVGDQDYTPLLRIQSDGSTVYNAPIVAFGADESRLAFCEGKPDYSLVHDRVMRLCPQKGTVTLALTQGFSAGRAVFYVSTDSSDRGVAAMEGATLAPRLADASPTGGYGEHSQVEPLLAVINGPAGASNAQRQGLESALVDGGGPLNVVGAIPTLGEGYSPLWSVNLAQWTAKAVNQGRRSRVTDLAKAMDLARRGWITGPGGKAFGPIGVVVNCPVVQRLQ
jgi:hypothetical protein